MKSDTPLPSDPIAQSLLSAAIQKAATETPSAVGGTPDLAKEISGKAFKLSDNVTERQKLYVESVCPDSVLGNH